MVWVITLAPACADSLNDLLVQHVGAVHPHKRMGWHPAIVLGYVGITGTVQQTNVAGQLRLRYRATRWVNTFRIHAIRTSVPGASPASARLTANNQTRYHFDRNNYLGLLLQSESDPAIGYTHRNSVIAGFGRNLLRGTQSIRAEFGAGARFSRLTARVHQHEVIGLVAVYYRVRPFHRLSIHQALLLEPGTLDFYAQSVTDVHERLSGRLAFVVSFNATYNNRPPFGISATTNTVSTISLQYGF
ncbi:MAG: DUF481 domain-containing protein [Acidiferrobacteraceae bacterium]